MHNIDKQTDGSNKIDKIDASHPVQVKTVVKPSKVKEVKEVDQVDQVDQVEKVEKVDNLEKVAKADRVQKVKEVVRTKDGRKKIVEKIKPAPVKSK